VTADHLPRDHARRGGARPSQLPPPHPPDPAAQAAALVAVLATLAGLGMTSLVPVPVCLLAAACSTGVVVGLRFVPALTTVAPLRVSLALGLMGVVAVAGSRSVPDLPVLGPFEIIPTGVLAALAAGAVVASVLEFGTVRGVRFGVVLTGAVTALTASLVPGPHIVPALCLGWPAALFALARVDGVEALARSRTGGPQPRPAARAITRWHVVPAVAGIAVACTALVLLRVGGLSHTDGLSSGDGFGDSGVTRSGSTRAVRSGASYLGTTMDLRMRGTLADTPVLRVPADSPALWRGGVLDTYAGSQWSAGEGVGERPSVVVHEGGVDLEWPAPVPGVPRDDVVRPQVPWASVVVAAGRPEAVSADALGRTLGAVATSGERVLFLSAVPSYQVRSAPLPRVGDPAWADLLSGAAPGGGGPVTVDGRYTELPPTVPARVRDLGRRLVAGAPDRRAAVLAVERELRTRLEYRLDSPRPRRGDDPVDDVLFRSHSGFCEQFASAEVVLLRSAGVPARMATGFAGGETDGSERVLRASDGHAWVEVWFPGVGWVSSDPTAGARRATAWWSDLASLGRRVAGEPALLALCVAGLLGLAGGIVVLVLRRRRAPAVAPVARAGPARVLSSELAAAFARLESALAEAGNARRPAETVAALGDRVAPDAAVRAAFAVLERALYARTPPSRAECGVAARELDRASTRVLAAVR
jgi:protein-glutamine gamma-glutamyltransferase